MFKKRFFVVSMLVLTLVLSACAAQAAGSDSTPVATPDPPYAVIAAEQALGESLGMPVDEIDYVSFERVEWPDACLGFAEPGEKCLERLTPGWLVILEAKGHQFDFHTDMNGENLRWRQQTGTGDPGQIDDADAVTLQGIAVTIDVTPALATGITRELVSATSHDKDTPYWAVQPEHFQLTLNDYVRQSTFHTARIYVYPVDDFESTNQAAAERIAKLRRILEERPLSVTEDIPFLPLFNAGQMVQTQFGYWAFESGIGVRFVTQYGQGAGPINNNELFYAFQGLTYDGDYYVSAILPVSHPDLPADASKMPAGGWERYVRDVEQQLNVADPSSFQPGLASLDQMIRTLTISSASPTSQTVSPALECTVFYRPATTAEGQAQAQERTFSLAKNRDQERVTFADLELQARYADDPYEGRSLVVSVIATDMERQVTQQLYQFLPDEGPHNQFAGGHGFTGLAYLYHPLSAAELQYFCQSR
jgi:hypothetical protein